MAGNITIRGLKGDTPKAETKILVENFLEEELEVELEEDEKIPVAHRLGPVTKGYHRPVVFECPPSLRARIFQNTGKLAGKSYSVNQQLPDAIEEQKREIRQQIKNKQREEEGKDENNKSTFLVRNNKLYINGQLQRKKIIPPLPKDLFVNNTDKQRMEALNLKYSAAKPAQHSSFMAAALAVENMSEVHAAYKRLFREFPEADHIVTSCIVNGESAFRDDSEFGAGHRMLNILFDHKLGNVVLFVIRHYGEHIGPMRFAVMREVAEEALLKLG